MSWVFPACFFSPGRSVTYARLAPDIISKQLERLRIRSGRYVAPLSLVAVVAGIMYVHPSIPFANDGHCDPWYIFGMFYTFPSALHWFGSDYQVSRLTEILPGYFFTRIFSSIRADYALFLVYYSISIVFFYSAVRRLLTRDIGVLSSLFLALNPLMIGNYSVTLDAPAIMFDIVNLYLVAAAMDCSSSRRRNALIFASGIAFALALNAYVAIGILGVGNYVIYASYVFTRGSQTPRERVRLILASVLFTAAGALTMLVLLGLVMVAFHGTFDEAFRQFQFLLTIFANFRKMGRGVGALYWHSTWYEQGAISGMLVLAGATSILNIICLPKKAEENSDDLREKLLAVSWGVLFVEGTLLAANAAGFVLLHYDYYYVFFVPYLALALFSPLALLGPILGRVASAFAIVFAVCGLIADSFTDGQLPALFGGSAQGQTSIMIVLCVLPLFVAIASQKRRLAISVVVALATLTILIERPIEVGITMWTESRAQEQSDADSYVRIRQGLVFLESLHFSEPPSVFWLEPSVGTEYVAYPRSYMTCSFWSFPSHPVGSAPLSVGEDVVVVSSQNHLAEKATAALDVAPSSATIISGEQ